jgi:alcohol dehydrogenase
MRALRLVAEQQLELVDIADPAPPGEGTVAIRVLAIALNHIDLWGYRGMAFAKRKLPLVVGAEAVGEIVALGAGVTSLAVGQRVSMYGAHVCGDCPSCRAGRDNHCENVAGIFGFHIDGFARERIVMPARLTVPVPDSVSTTHAACASVTFATVEHMLFDNARLMRGETILVHAAGSGIGTAAVTLAKAAGCFVIATVGDDAKGAKARALGADHVINYRQERFESVVRKLTGKRGVDVVFEHIGADTWKGSLLSLRRGGRLVTCGATSGPAGEINLMQLFQQQYRIIGSFGASIRNVATGLEKMALGLTPTIAAEVPIEEFGKCLERLRSRDVIGKLVVRIAA